MVRKALSSSGHTLPAVGKGHASRYDTAIARFLEPRCTHTDADVDEVKEENKRLRKELNMLRKVVKSDDEMSQLLTQLESQHEVGGGSGSGRSEDVEPGADEDAGGDEES
ncbi:hypothetical protein Tco_0676081 [Tanacetum coccineum]